MTTVSTGPAGRTTPEQGDVSFDCRKDIDLAEHVVLASLTRGRRSPDQPVVFGVDKIAMGSPKCRKEGIDAFDLRWAMERLIEAGYLERVDPDRCLVKILIPCGCGKGFAGMYDDNPPCPHDGQDEWGVQEESGPSDSDTLDTVLDGSGRIRRPERACEQRPPGTKSQEPGRAQSEGRHGRRPAPVVGEWEESVSDQNDMAGDMAPPKRGSYARGKARPPAEWNAWELAEYFRDQCVRRAWGRSTEPANVKALAGRLAQWRRQGVTSAEIKTIMDTYIGRVAADRSRSAPLWKQFISQSQALLQQMRTGSDGRSGEDIRYDREAWVAYDDNKDGHRYDREYWLR